MTRINNLAGVCQAVGIFRMVFWGGEWHGKWTRQTSSFLGLTTMEKEVLENYCEWLRTTFDSGMDEKLIEFVHSYGDKSGRGTYSINLDIDEDSYATVEYTDGASDYPVCIRLYRRVSI